MSLKDVNASATTGGKRWRPWFYCHEKVVVEDPIKEPICGPVVVAGVFFSQSIHNDWSKFREQFNRENLR